uniref:Uncharacterized protein n=1 Tax=Steinernema glaseri TaxID=37863 RepID=A0A1I8A7M1_9BILA
MRGKIVRARRRGAFCSYLGWESHQRNPSDHNKNSTLVQFVQVDFIQTLSASTRRHLDIKQNPNGLWIPSSGGYFYSRRFALGTHGHDRAAIGRRSLA